MCKDLQENKNNKIKFHKKIYRFMEHFKGR